MEAADGTAAQLGLGWRERADEANGVFPKAAVVFDCKSLGDAVGVPLLLALGGYVGGNATM